MNYPCTASNKEIFVSIIQNKQNEIILYAKSISKNDGTEYDFMMEAIMRLIKYNSLLESEYHTVCLIKTTIKNLYFTRNRAFLKRRKGERGYYLYNNESEPVDDLMVKRIRAAINTLPPRCKHIFCQYIQLENASGGDISEVAKKLNIPIRTVYNQLSIARIKIREIINKQS